MQSVDVRSVLSALDGAELGREFDVLYLWALSREHIRELVVTYNEERHIGEEDSVTSRIAADLVALNIHRTPLNCLTVLKASEMDFSESPVNRTEMLGRVLFILFNVDAIPRYKLRPDMKDCEYVLGYFCEQLIRENTYFFARDKFLEDLRAFCQKRVMLMDVDALFDILHGNHIVVAFGSLFCFRFTYWVYYFAAQRMHHDAAFAEFVLSDMMYARFPEVIEFYTGIDRRRADALKILTEDLQRGIGLVKVKCGLPDDVNVYPFLQWQPTVAGLEAMRNEISNGVAASNLPDVIKERYADRGYDRARPYDQAVRDVLSGDSLASVMLSMSAGARALRNSDYVDPQVRRALLDQILLGWKELTRVLWVLLPLLAERQSALFDGIVFRASSEFGSTLEERFRRILMAIPENVVSWYRDDLYSPKMGPLLLQTIGREVDDLTKHELALILIAKRPAGWRAQIENYVNNISKNSFYLFDVNRRLRTTYQFAFLSLIEVRDLEYLIKMTATKHVHGIKRPGVRAIKRVPNSVLPDRSGTDEANRGQTTNT